LTRYNPETLNDTEPSSPPWRGGRRPGWVLQPGIDQRDMEWGLQTDDPAFDPQLMREEIVHLIRKMHDYTLLYLAEANGILEGDTEQGVASGYDGRPVTARPNPGFRFGGWSDGNTNAARTDLSVTSNLTVTADFEPDTWTLTYVAGSNGLLQIDGGAATSQVVQVLEAGSTGTAVTAVGDLNYEFFEWSDLNTDNPRTDVVSGDLTVTANFEVIEYLADPSFENEHAQWFLNEWVGSPEIAIETGIAHDGTRAVKIIADANERARVMFRGGFQPYIEAGRYRFSFWLKGNNVADDAMVISFFDTGWYWKYGLGGIDIFGGDYEWKKVSYVKDVPTSGIKELYIGLANTGTIWIDQISIERVDPNEVDESEPQFVQ